MVQARIVIREPCHELLDRKHAGHLALRSKEYRASGHICQLYNRQMFFAAYDTRDVEGMLALCADDAQGRYTPSGRDSVVPIRGGLDAISPHCN